MFILAVSRAVMFIAVALLWMSGCTTTHRGASAGAKANPAGTLYYKSGLCRDVYANGTVGEARDSGIKQFIEERMRVHGIDGKVVSPSLSVLDVNQRLVVINKAISSFEKTPSKVEPFYWSWVVRLEPGNVKLVAEFTDFRGSIFEEWSTPSMIVMRDQFHVRMVDLSTGRKHDWPMKCKAVYALGHTAVCVNEDVITLHDLRDGTQTRSWERDVDVGDQSEFLRDVEVIDDTLFIFRKQYAVNLRTGRSESVPTFKEYRPIRFYGGRLWRYLVRSIEEDATPTEFRELQSVPPFLSAPFTIKTSQKRGRYHFSAQTVDRTLNIFTRTSYSMLPGGTHRRSRLLAKIDGKHVEWEVGSANPLIWCVWEPGVFEELN